MNMHLSSLALGAIVIGSTAGIAAAAQLPDGSYYCSISGMGSGSIEIVGNTYKGPAFDGNYEGTYEYELTNAGTVNWFGPVGAYTEDGYAIVSTVTYGGDTIRGFDMIIDQPDSDNMASVGCELE
jgi:hypothetical protein